MQKAKERYSKEKAAEYYFKTKEAIKEKSREIYNVSKSTLSRKIWEAKKCLIKKAYQESKKKTVSYQGTLTRV